MFPSWKRERQVTRVPVPHSDVTLYFPTPFCFLASCKDCKDGSLLFFFIRLEKKCTRFCGVCGSIVLLHWWVPWYGWHSFAVIWNWIRGVGEGGRDDEEYQSFCLLCEVICGSTESAIMKVHLFTTEGLWVNFTSPMTPDLEEKGTQPSAEAAVSVQSEWLFTRVCPHSVCYDVSLRGFAMPHRLPQTQIAMSV